MRIQFNRNVNFFSSAVVFCTYFIIPLDTAIGYEFSKMNNNKTYLNKTQIQIVFAIEYVEYWVLKFNGIV